MREEPRSTGDLDLAIAVLAHIASDSILLRRFLDLTGIDASDIRRAAAEPGFLAGVLDFVLAHEPTLIEVAESLGVEPQSLARARRSLAPGDRDYESST
ncbi:MAG: DUF3572 domain-containing protein [Rhizobiaceae bacterium]|nr:DUF3572 domain-containing protein [Rhizobiaceae bacterium]MCV0406265.1 DUF3572 domain-containing protein [Rhizobiaceae bacterium]